MMASASPRHLPPGQRSRAGRRRGADLGHRRAAGGRRRLPAARRRGAAGGGDGSRSRRACGFAGERGGRGGGARVRGDGPPPGHAGAGRLHPRAPRLPPHRAALRPPGVDPAAGDRAARRGCAGAEAEHGPRRRDRDRRDRAGPGRELPGRARPADRDEPRRDPQVQITAVDTSAQALQLAAENVVAMGFEERVTLELGALPSSPREFDLVVANLPYVRDDEWPRLQPEITKYEPREALTSGRRWSRRDPRAARESSGRAAGLSADGRRARDRSRAG